MSSNEKTSGSVATRYVVATVAVVLIIVGVWKFVDWRNQPPPPPHPLVVPVPAPNP